MDKQNIGNLICPVCGKKISAKTFENWHCENCGIDLSSVVYRNSKKEYVARSFQVIGLEVK